MAKTLNIIESAYRATLEEQDDTIVWIVSAMRKGGADVDVLLTGSAVNYATKNQDASGLQFGAWKQTQPPDLARDLEALREQGATIYLDADEAERRGLAPSELSPAVAPIAGTEVAALFDGYERIWRW